MTPLIFLKILLNVIFNDEERDRRLTRMIRVRRLRSITGKFLDIYPNAQDSCGAHIAAHYAIIDDLIERHTQAARHNDMNAMAAIESALTTIHSIICETMENHGSLSAFPEMKTLKVQMPGTCDLSWPKRWKESSKSASTKRLSPPIRRAKRLFA